MKDLDGRKVTFDANGNVVNIKNINLEKLNNDFYQPKYIKTKIIDVKLKKHLTSRQYFLIDLKKVILKIYST